MSFHISWAIYSVWLGEEVNVCSWEWIVRKQEEFKIRPKASTSALDSIHWARKRNRFGKEYNELSFGYGISVSLFFSTMHKVPRTYIWKQNNSISGRKPMYQALNEVYVKETGKYIFWETILCGFLWSCGSFFAESPFKNVCIANSLKRLK